MNNKKETYRKRNEEYLAGMAAGEGVSDLGGGVLYKVVSAGEGQGSVMPNSIVTIRYRGCLISGKEFDNTWDSPCPEAFRVNELIEGFQMALRRMHIGDRWMVYIPWQKGYGKRPVAGIPGYSTLIFEVELISIA